MDQEAVFIECQMHDTHTMFKVKVAAGEMGAVIGKQGRTARALRTLLSARSGRDGARYVLYLVERDEVAQ